MSVMSMRVWDDRDAMVTDPETVASILRSLEFATGQIIPYLELLEQRQGVVLPHLRALARHSFVFQSGDDHLNLRRAIAPFFSHRAVERWLPVIRSGIAAALDRLSSAREPDLMRDFAEPAFLSTMRPFIGLSGGEDARVTELIRTANDATHPMLSLSALKAIDAAIGELAGHLSKEPGDERSLVGFLAERCGRFEDPLAVNHVALSALLAGHTMAQTLSCALYALLSGQLEVWRKVAEPGWAENSLERCLSLYPSTLTLVRASGKDQEVAGCPFHGGQTVVMDVVTANAKLRNECQAGEPPRLLSFGAGVHKCPGDPLSRLFIAEALPALARAFPHLSIQRDLVRHHVTPLVQYPTVLPCERDSNDRRVNARLVEIRGPEAALRIVNDDTRWSPPAMEVHLRAVQEKTGEDLGQAVRIARNAMFFMSGERHAVARRAVAECLGGNRLAMWQPLLDGAVQAGLDDLATAPKPDLIEDFADPLFRAITKPILGIASSDPARFDALAPLLQDVLEPWLPLRELLRLQKVFDELLATMRPPPDAEPAGVPLLTHLLASDLPGFDEDDLKSLVLVLYGASFNLAHTLGNTVHHLLSQSPEERAGADDPAWIEAHLEQLIALCASPKYIYRMARADAALGALDIRGNETLRLRLLSINRGAATGNLAFGHGLHRCVGAALSKRMLRTAVPALFTRFPEIALEPQRHRYQTMSQTVALARLPCRLGRRIKRKADDRP